MPTTHRDEEAWIAATALAQACRRLHARGLLAGTEGNLSVRLAGGDLVVTPSGVDKGAVEAAQMLCVGFSGSWHASGGWRHDGTRRGAPGDGDPGDSTSRPSSELGMHLACYAARPDVRAVVHAHPPFATGFATAGRTVPANVLPEIPVVVGPVALVPYGRPGTTALAMAMGPYLDGHEVFLLSNHGVTTVGTSLSEAVLRLESIEQAAHILFVAHGLGGAQPLDAAEAAALAALSPTVKRLAREHDQGNRSGSAGSEGIRNATGVTVDGAPAQPDSIGSTSNGLS